MGKLERTRLDQIIMNYIMLDWLGVDEIILKQSRLA